MGVLRDQPRERGRRRRREYSAIGASQQDQRILCQCGQALNTQPEILDLLTYQFGRVLARDLAFHHLADVIVVDPDDQFVVLDPLLAADPRGCRTSSMRARTRANRPVPCGFR